MSNEYRIGVIADFLTVPAERIDECLADFKEWISLARDSAQLTSSLDDAFGDNGSFKFQTDSFTWIDDGIRGITAIQIIDSRTPDESIRLGLSKHAHTHKDAVDDAA